MLINILGIFTMKKTFFYKKCSLMVLVLLFSGIMKAMDDVAEVNSWYETEDTVNPFAKFVNRAADVAQKAVSVGLKKAQQLSDAVVDAEKENKNEGSSEAVEVKIETPFSLENSLSAESKDSGGPLNNDLSDLGEITTAEKYTLFTSGSRELLMIGGTAALAAVVIGGITFILYKNGQLKCVGEVIKDHPFITAACTSAFVGIALSYLYFYGASSFVR
jgi:hypothetical protein